MKTLIDVVDYWFEKQKDYKKWFFSGTTLDTYISDNYKDLLDFHLQNNYEYDMTKSNLKKILGKIILLDQFSRHVYRNTAKAYDGERFALPMSKGLLESGLLDFFSTSERIFALMPLQHSENVEDKQFILNYLDDIENRGFTSETQGHRTESLVDTISMLSSFKKHTLNHHHILKTYGRYPKRNEALLRQSNQSELEYLQKNPNRHF